jgi:hypothetical protein
MEHEWVRMHDVRVGYLSQRNEWCTRCGVLRRTTTILKEGTAVDEPLSEEVTYRSPGAPGKWGRQVPSCRGLV